MSIATAATWTESGSATNGTATASHAAESGKAHYVTSVVAGFTGSGNVADLTLSDGSTTIMTVTVHDDIELEFSHPVRISVGSKAEVSLGAAGAGVDGNVFLAGFTESS